MKWNVHFYDHHVMKTIQNWPPSIKAKFTWIVDLIEDIGPNEIGMPHIKSMRKCLFEIRAKGNDGIGRAFFCIKRGRIIIILSGFMKKTQKTPQREINRALKLMKQVIK